MKIQWPVIILISMLLTSVSVVLAQQPEPPPQSNRPAATPIIVFNDGVNVAAAANDMARAHGLTITHTYR